MRFVQKSTSCLLTSQNRQRPRLYSICAAESLEKAERLPCKLRPAPIVYKPRGIIFDHSMFSYNTFIMILLLIFLITQRGIMHHILCVLGSLYSTSMHSTDLSSRHIKRFVLGFQPTTTNVIPTLTRVGPLCHIVTLCFHRRYDT